MAISRRARPKPSSRFVEPPVLSRPAIRCIGQVQSWGCVLDARGADELNLGLPLSYTQLDLYGVLGEPISGHAAFETAIYSCGPLLHRQRGKPVGFIHAVKPLRGGVSLLQDEYQLILAALQAGLHVQMTLKMEKPRYGSGLIESVEFVAGASLKAETAEA